MYGGMCIYDLQEERPVDFVDEKQAYKELEEYDQERFCLAKLILEPYEIGNGCVDAVETYELLI